MILLRFDSGERAADPALDLGILTYPVEEEKAAETRAAIETLGFTIIEEDS